MKYSRLYVIPSLVAFCLSMSLTLRAQTQERIDSLKSILTQEIADSLRVSTLLELSNKFFPKQLDSVMHYSLILDTFGDKIGDKQAKAKAMRLIGNVQYMKKDFAKAIEYYEKGISLLKAGDADVNMLVDFQVYLMDGHIRNGEFQAAIDVGLSLISIMAQNEISENNKGRVFKYIGNAYLSSGDNATAISYYQKCGKIYTDPNKKVTTQNDLAVLLMKKRDFSGVLQLLLPMVDLVETENINQLQIFRTYTLLGGVYMGTKQAEKAIFYLTTAEGYTDLKSNPKFFIRNGDRIGMLYRELNQYDKAITAYSLALKIGKERNISLLRNDILNGLGYSYYFSGQYDSAIVYFEKNLSLAQDKRTITFLPRHILV